SSSPTSTSRSPGPGGAPRTSSTAPARRRTARASASPPASTPTSGAGCASWTSSSPRSRRRCTGCPPRWTPPRAAPSTTRWPARSHGPTRRPSSRWRTPAARPGTAAGWSRSSCGGRCSGSRRRRRWFAVPEVGSDRRMHDAEERVVGTVPFVLDVRVDGMAHAKAVRSPFPHARIRSVRTDDALAVPGVLLVLTGADLDADPAVNPYHRSPRPGQPALAIGKARYAGEPVAVVVAETAAAAAAAAPLVEVDYEELPHVVDANEAARPGAPVVHDAWPDNGCGSWRVRHGDPDAALASADRVYTGVYHSPSASHVPMEPMVCIADWTGGGLEVWSAT